MGSIYLEAVNVNSNDPDSSSHLSEASSISPDFKMADQILSLFISVGTIQNRYSNIRACYSM